MKMNKAIIFLSLMSLCSIGNIFGMEASNEMTREKAFGVFDINNPSVSANIIKFAYYVKAHAWFKYRDELSNSLEQLSQINEAFEFLYEKENVFNYDRNVLNLGMQNNLIENFSLEQFFAHKDFKKLNNTATFYSFFEAMKRLQLPSFPIITEEAKKVVGISNEFEKRDASLEKRNQYFKWALGIGITASIGIVVALVWYNYKKAAVAA